MSPERISGWGRHPRVRGRLLRPADPRAARALLDDGFTGIARGAGRSYGDSALARTLLDTGGLDHFVAFDEESGALTCESGVSLGEIIDHFLPRGWYPPVVPGTAAVTVGGAIASDVHGKNHHLDGGFCAHLDWLEVLLGDGRILRCGPDQERELFDAVCGGMGLVGLILRARLRLRRVNSSRIVQQRRLCPDLSAVLACLDSDREAPYSVAWIDTAARGAGTGRGVVHLGRFADDGIIRPTRVRSLRVPRIPVNLLNRTGVSVFNRWYYRRQARVSGESRVDHRSFFFPLDSLEHWNRLYGPKGFLQYQFVVPDAAAEDLIGWVLATLQRTGQHSFLSVLKRLGPAGNGILGFPMEGITLALDLPRTRGLEALLERFDEAVAEQGGRVYLTKDARLGAEMFRRFYPDWQRLERLREDTGGWRFSSLQSIRLGFREREP